MSHQGCPCLPKRWTRLCCSARCLCLSIILVCWLATLGLVLQDHHDFHYSGRQLHEHLQVSTAPLGNESLLQHNPRYMPVHDLTTELKKVGKFQGRTSIDVPICGVIPVHNLTAVGRKKSVKFDDLVKSVMDTWGDVEAPDVFRTVFPTIAVFAEYVTRCGGIGDERLVTLTSGPKDVATPQRPSTVKLFGAMRTLGGLSDDCQWYHVLDIDGYFNPDAIRPQVRKYDSSQRHLLGAYAKREEPWNKSWYFKFSSGATGHLISRALLLDVDWYHCIDELLELQAGGLQYQRKIMGHGIIRHDDAETGACMHRQYPAPLIKRDTFWHMGWTQKPGENKEVRDMLNKEVAGVFEKGRSKVMELMTAHRLTPALNFDVVSFIRQRKKRPPPVQTAPCVPKGEVHPDWLRYKQEGQITQKEHVVAASRLLDYHVVLGLVKYEGKLLEFVDERYRSDKAVVMQAVASYGKALRFADEALRGDPDVAKAAVASDPAALEYVADTLRNAPDLSKHVAGVGGGSNQKSSGNASAAST
eukprot:TRINITY_DN57952_c0_g1_i1.p1 TRINITY_DN57952_c0_g1~~TRINITY_DN57952_c0_g1_i1.p1  ORF type:complete len:529 (-),score=92.09 TRINITY_DN57952_c0_g1_i1:475-2061(-)